MVMLIEIYFDYCDRAARLQLMSVLCPAAYRTKSLDTRSSLAPADGSYVGFVKKGSLAGGYSTVLVNEGEDICRLQCRR